MLRAKYHRVRWLSPKQVRVQRIRDLFNRSPTKALFGEKFFEAAVKRRDDLQKLRLKLIGLQIPIYAGLALSLVPVDLSLSVAGFASVGAAKLREVLLLVSSLLALFTSATVDRQSYLDEIISTYVAKQANDDRHAAKVLGFVYGDEAFWSPSPAEPHLTEGTAHRVLTAAFVVAGVAAVVVIALMALYIHVALLIDIYRNPGLPRGLSIGILGFTILVDLYLFLLALLTAGIFPYWDFEHWRKVSRKLDERPELVKQLSDRMWKDYARVPAPLRWFTRPKLPPDFAASSQAGERQSGGPGKTDASNGEPPVAG